MTRKNKLITLTVQHRSARSPDPVILKLEQDPAPHLLCQDGQDEPTPCATLSPLAERIRYQLENAARPMTTVELRERLRRRKSDIVTAIEILQEKTIIHRTSNGWLFGPPSQTVNNNGTKP